MKNILLCQQRGWLDGAARSLLLLAENLQKDYGLYFWVNEPGPLTQYLKERGLPVLILSNRPWRQIGYFLAHVLTIIRLVRFCRKNRIRLILSNTYELVPFIVWAGRALSVPVISFLRDAITVEKLEKYKAPALLQLISVSQSIIEAYQQKYANSAVVHNGVDLQHFIMRPGTLPNEFSLAVFGRLCDRKNQLFALKIFNNLRSQLDQAFLHFYGEADSLYLDQIMNYIKTHGLAAEVHVHHYIQDPRPAIQASQIILVPSKSEALPRVILEAMACGKTVVASAVGGIKEILSEPNVGICLPLESKKWEEVILDLFHHPQKRQQIGESARRHVSKYFDLRRTNKKILEMINHLLSDKMV